MRLLLTMLGAVVVLGLLSAGPLAQGRGPNHVTITVADGQISADPDVLNVVGRSANIRFEIGTEGWSFPATGTFGIAIQDNDGQFKNWTRVKDTFVRVLDQNSNSKDYKYNITVCGAEGDCITLDPVIRNNN